MNVLPAYVVLFAPGINQITVGSGCFVDNGAGDVSMLVGSGDK